MTKNEKIIEGTIERIFAEFKLTKEEEEKMKIRIHDILIGHNKATKKGE